MTSPFFTKLFFFNVVMVVQPFQKETSCLLILHANEFGERYKFLVVSLEMPIRIRERKESNRISQV
jgi:hypothetical protein